MKIHALATLAFITANGVKAQVVENPCVICPNGATAGDDLAPGADVGILTTCKELIETAPLFETGTLSCAAAYGFYEPTCCPAPLQDPCTLCPNGVTVADDIATSYYCSDIIKEFSQFESESDTCTIMGAYYEVLCCPTPPENPCNICPNGATAGDDFVPSSTVDEVVPYSIVGSPTCMSLITLAKPHETGSALCEYFEATGIYCCPDVTANTTTVPVEETSTLATAISGQDSCEACPNGATSTGEFEFQGVSTKCSDLISFAILFAPGSAECASLAVLEAVCCPPIAENPCEVCPNGVTFDGEVEFEGLSMTCSDIISVAMGLESGFDECAEVPREEVELICCPSGGIPEIGGGTVATTAAPAVEISTSATATAIPEIDGGTATTTAAPAVETSTSTNATVSPESNDAASGGVATTVIPVEETSTSATATAIPEIDGGTATTTAETSTSTKATASPDSSYAASGGVAISGFGGFSFVSVVSALWAIGFV